MPLAFALQTLAVFAFNSRLFGLLQPGSGWFTNVEMSQRYASLFTPARWAFAIWGVIYVWEAAAMVYLLVQPSSAPLFWEGWGPALWIAANSFQVTSCPHLCAHALPLLTHPPGAGDLGSSLCE